MRSYITAAIIFAVLLLTVPAIPLLLSRQSGKNTDFSESTVLPSPEQTTPAAETDEEKNTGFYDEKLKVLDITSGETEEISSFDYVVGAVCAQMPAAFEPEALKAQAVAAYTYAVRQRERSKTAPDKELGGAYFSNDTKKYQAFFTESQQKRYYGENYDEYIKKIEAAVKETAGEYMTFDGEPIIAAFHSLSPGMTESAENVWGVRIPYLVPADSSYDDTAPKYLREYEFTRSEMKTALEKAFSGIKLGDDPSEWFGKPKKTEAGTVLKIEAGDKTVTGQEIRTALSLCSAAFDIEYGDSFTVTTKGSGHFVGMSQFGANELAKTGKTYREILAHYYKDIKIEK